MATRASGSTARQPRLSRGELVPPTLPSPLPPIPKLSPAPELSIAVLRKEAALWRKLRTGEGTPKWRDDWLMLLRIGAKVASRNAFVCRAGAFPVLFKRTRDSLRNLLAAPSIRDGANCRAKTRHARDPAWAHHLAVTGVSGSSDRSPFQRRTKMGLHYQICTKKVRAEHPPFSTTLPSKSPTFLSPTSTDQRTLVHQPSINQSP